MAVNLLQYTFLNDQNTLFRLGHPVARVMLEFYAARGQIPLRYVHSPYHLAFLWADNVQEANIGKIVFTLLPAMGSL